MQFKLIPNSFVVLACSISPICFPNKWSTAR